MQPTKKNQGRTKIRAAEIASKPLNICRHCNALDGAEICRATLYGTPVYFYIGHGHDSGIYDGKNGRVLGSTATDRVYLVDVEDPIRIKLLLTYLDGNETNEEPYNVRLLCQKCNRRHSAALRYLRRQIKAQEPKEKATGISAVLESDPAQLTIFHAIKAAEGAQE